MKSSNLFALLVAAAAVAACGKSEPPPAPASSTSNAGKTPPVAAARTSPADKPAAKVDPEKTSVDKANKYIQANNRITGFLSFGANSMSPVPQFAEEQVAKGNFKTIRSSSAYVDDFTVKLLKEAMALPGDIPAVDKAAQQVLADIEKYAPNWKALEDYNKAKRYEDDNGAKGKEMLPTYVEGIAALSKSIGAFSKEVDTVARQQDDKRLAELKAQGKQLEVHTLESLAAGRDMLDLFESDTDLKDPKKIEQGNALLAKMETSLEGLKAEYAKRKAEAPNSLPRIDRYDGIARNLTTLAGNYREARKDPRRLNAAVKSFNDAVGDMNMMQR